MNIEIKKTVKAGNSSAVILPKAWLNQEVRVELVKKNPETILKDILDIVGGYVELDEIIGIYLVGSYARGEEDNDSDIDVLVISDNIDMEMIHEGIYNILIVSEELLEWKLSHDLLPVGAMLKEAKPLINSSYLDLIKIKVTKENIKWYIDTTEEKLKLVRKILKSTNGNKINDRVVYSLVLRIRTLYIIQKLIRNKVHSKKELIKLIGKISGADNAYESYLTVKNDLNESYNTTMEETEKLYGYLKNQLNDVKTLL
ncbi:nucleotidyltransferase domain-containing protein [Candidatus Woesearchaeota archaeon]|nr:nucleotidyltransferase domain-containing protein [Candidatus Woesearchaeota archaeon]